MLIVGAGLYVTTVVIAAITMVKETSVDKYVIIFSRSPLL